MDINKVVRATLLILLIPAFIINYSLFLYYHSDSDKSGLTENKIQDLKPLDREIYLIIVKKRLFDQISADIEENTQGLEAIGDVTRHKIITNYCDNSNISHSVEKLAIVKSNKPIVPTSNLSYVLNNNNEYVAFIRCVNFSYKSYDTQASVTKFMLPRIRGPTNKKRAFILNATTITNFMQRVKFSREQKAKVLTVCRKLFPQYSYISIKGESVKFSPVKPGSLKAMLVPSVAVSVPIFDLILTEFPKRLSIYKCGNSSFIPLYLSSLVYFMSINPSTIADYFYEKTQDIQSPYKPHEYALSQISSVLMEERSAEQNKRNRAAVFHRARSTCDNTAGYSGMDFKDFSKMTP